MWLYKPATQMWHIWPEPVPEDGDNARCGEVLDDTCNDRGDPAVPQTRCQACVVAQTQISS